MPSSTLGGSPLIQRFHGYQPGDIHSVAAKAHLLTGFEACKGNTLVDAVWNEDGTALVASFNDGARTTLLLDGFRLLTKCTCNQWQPARNCPHVVIVWATLKRIVSPETLSHIRFNKNLLDDMKRYIEREPAPMEKTAVGAPELREHPEKTVAGTNRSRDEHDKKTAHRESPTIRLVIFKDPYEHGLSGRFLRGDVNLSGWTSSGVPTDLARFMASHSYYESTPRYMATFLKQTGGRYPMFFRDSNGSEYPLVYRVDAPRRASVSFDIRGEEVIVSRVLDNGAPIPAGAVMHDQLLFDLRAGTIHPLTGLDAWAYWDDVVNQLDTAEDFYKDEDFEQDAAGRDDELFEHDATRPVIALAKIRALRHAVAVPLELFNAAGVLLDPALDPRGVSRVFLVNGAIVERPRPASPGYLLDIPGGLASKDIILAPLGTLDGLDFACSTRVFGLLNPERRAIISPPLRTRKRLRAVLETAFELLDEKSERERKAIIAGLMSSPDFSRPELKREAMLLLERLHETWSEMNSLLLAAPDGWRCAAEDHARQARLLRIMVDRFGLEAFTTGFAPGEVRIDRNELQRIFPDVVEQLTSHGFTVRVGSLTLVDVSWEFFLDATSSGLDWFELHPEIRCDGEALSVDEIRALLEGNGMLCRQGRLLMLDETKTRLLVTFAAALPPLGKKGSAGDKAVRAPRLRMLEWLQLRQHGVTVRLPEEDERVLESLLGFERIPERALPAGLNATLRHYQADAWRWLAFLYDHRFGACLADDMGLGKTLQGITLLAGVTTGAIKSSAPAGAPHLVVAPPSLLFNWEAEIARFFPAARVAMYSGPGRSPDTLHEYDVVITSYGIVQRDIAKLEKHPFNVIIFDEAQVVKNLQAATTGAVRGLKGAFALALTGTPVENHLGEFYAIMDLCLPGLLGTREEFGRQLGRGGEAAAALIRRTRPFVLRRTKEMIASELPPKIEIDIPLELTPKQKTLYQRTVEEVRGQVRDAFDGSAKAQARIIALTAILRLRQVCLSPALTGSTSTEPSPKFEFLRDQLLELRDEGHSALVFSQFTGFLDIIQQGLVESGLTCLRLDGSTPVPQRKKLVQAFQNSAGPAVFLISLKAGGRGLNLTRASYVYHMDPWWNPAVENQASDRAHRIGQTGQVTITRLIMRHTIEEKMMQLKERKLRLYEAVLGEGTAAASSALSREDFEYLLT